MRSLFGKFTLKEACLSGLSLAIAVAVVFFAQSFSAHSGVLHADNTLLTIAMITREALRVLENNLTFTLKVNRQFDDKFGVDGAKIGSVCNVRKPPKYTVRQGAGLDIQDATETQVPVTLDKQYGVDLSFSSVDLLLSIDDFSQRFLQPAISAIANKIDLDGLTLAKGIAQTVGTPGTTPNAWLTYLQAGVKLDNSAAPMDGRRAVVITPLMQATLVDALKGLFQQAAAISSQYIKGQMGTSGGFDFYMDQNCYVHTIGALGGTPAVNTNGQSGSSLITDGWTNSVANRVAVGDVFTIAGVYAVNPQSRQSTGELKQFVATEVGASDVSGNMTISISPAIVGPGSPFQNVSALPIDGALLVFFGAANTVTPQGLAFHPDAFTFVTADLPLPRGVDMAARMSDKQLGMSVRLVRAYNIQTDQFPCRLDVLCGWAILREELACRIAA